MKIDINITASEELTKSILAFAEFFNNAVPIFNESSKSVKSKEVQGSKEKVKGKKEKAEVKKEDTKAITLEEVRAKLAALSQSGNQAQVKALITEFGAKKLSDIPADKYPELLKKVEVL